MTDLPQDIKNIDDRIRKMESKAKAEVKRKSQTSKALQQAFRYAAEFVAPVVIAIAIGWPADDFFGTKPVIMLVMVMFGCAAGVLNVYKAALETDKDIR